MWQLSLKIYLLNDVMRKIYKLKKKKERKRKKKKEKDL